MSEQERIDSARYILNTTYAGLELTTDQYQELFDRIFRLLEAWDYELERAS